MTMAEAVDLVLSAAPMAECAATFVLDMGEPVRIVDLVAGTPSSCTSGTYRSARGGRQRPAVRTRSR